MSFDFNEHEFDWISLQFPVSLHPLVSLPPLRPESAPTREPYSYTFTAPAADAELSVSEWIRFSLLELKEEKKKRDRNEQHAILAHYAKSFLGHHAFTSVGIRGKIIFNWHFGEHFFSLFIWLPSKLLAVNLSASSPTAPDICSNAGIPSVHYYTSENAALSNYVI